MAALPGGSLAEQFNIGDFGVVGDTGISGLSGLTQSAIEAFYKSQIQSSNPWLNASNTLFSGLDPSLPFPVALIKALLKKLIHNPLLQGAIDAIFNMGGAWAVLQEWGGWLWNWLAKLIDGFWDVLETAGSVIWKIVQAITGGLTGGLSTLITWGSGLLQWGWNNFVKPILGAILGQGVDLDITGLGIWARKLLNIYSPLPAKNITGIISSTLLGIIPVSHISDTQPNLLTHGNFETADSVEEADGWSWDDTTSHTEGGGCLKVTLDGTAKQMYSTQSIPVAKGDKIKVSCWVKTTDFPGSGGTFPVALSLVPFAGQTQMPTILINQCAETTSWFQITGNNYIVPEGITSVRVKLSVNSSVPSGHTVWFDEVFLSKTGLLQQDYVERLVDAWDNFWNGIFGTSATGKTVDDLLVAGSAVAGTANTASTNATSALGQIASTLSSLWNAPASLIGSIVNVVMDGVSTIGGFLTSLWNGLTGGSGSNKTVAQVASAAATTTSNVSTATTNANNANTNLQNTWNSLWNNLTGNVGGTGKTWSDAGSAAGSLRGTATGTLDNIVTGFRGWGNSGYSNTDVNDTGVSIADAVSALNARIAAMQAQEAAGLYSGTAVAVDFSAYPDGSSMGVNWSQLYSGGSPAFFSPLSKVVKWQGATNAASSRTVRCLYLPGTTTTDYQRVGATYSSAPGFTPNPTYNYLYGRMNATGDRYVYARIGLTNIQIGYNSSGTDVALSTLSRAFSPGTYWLEVGTNGSALRTYRLWLNDVLLMTVVEGGTSSLVGASYRYTGIGGTVSTASTSIAVSSAVSAFAFYDNVAPTIRGAGFRARKGTYNASWPDQVSSITCSVGSRTFPGKWYDPNPDYITSDITWDWTTGRVTVSVPGWYSVTVNQYCSGDSPGSAGGHQGACVYVNGSVVQKAPAVASFLAVGVNSFGGTFLVYCNAGDYIQAGMHSDWNISNSNWILGESSGTQTSFSVSFVNNRKPEIA